MFERYTEKARRTIFFGRYEASQFGSPYIDTEHLLLGLLREDKVLANRFVLPHTSFDSIRKKIEGHTVPREKVSTSVDLPLSHGCKRVLTYGAEEAERLNHQHIGTEHLLLGLLREEECFAAQLLGEQGLTLDSLRKQLQQSQPPPAQAKSASFGRLEQWLADCEAGGDFCFVTEKRGPNRTSHFAIYAVHQGKENEKGQDRLVVAKLAQIQNQIDFAIERMEHAIAHHEFDKARFYSDEERKRRENLRLLREQFNLEESSPEVPLLCVGIIGDEPFSEIQQHCDRRIAKGVAQIWLLDPALKRAYTFTQVEGLREFKGRILQIANPPLEMNLQTIFD
jgi:ATP-dependent Clp protease ATP-binding subunit ClpA